MALIMDRAHWGSLVTAFDEELNVFTFNHILFVKFENGSSVHPLEEHNDADILGTQDSFAESLSKREAQSKDENLYGIDSPKTSGKRKEAKDTNERIAKLPLECIAEIARDMLEVKIYDLC